MPNITDFPARGKIIQSGPDKLIVFNPTGTNYQLHLTPSDGSVLPVDLDQPVEALIKVQARKIWTVPTGGNFIAPIFGPPKTIQGRVKWLDEKTLVVQAGTLFVVEMPGSSDVIDLANGVIEAGCLVNVTAMPGARVTIPPAMSVVAERAQASKSFR